MKRSYNLIHAFRYAFNGLWLFLQNETNGKIQTAIALLVVVAGFIFKISSTEWMILLLFIGLVIALEMINSAIEKICDLVEPDQHPVIKIVKDLSAGAVLWISLISVIAGLTIFIPKLNQL